MPPAKRGLSKSAFRPNKDEVVEESDMTCREGSGVVTEGEVGSDAGGKIAGLKLSTFLGPRRTLGSGGNRHSEVHLAKLVQHQIL